MTAEQQDALNVDSDNADCIVVDTYMLMFKPPMRG